MALSDDILKLLDKKDQRLTDIPLKYEIELGPVQRRLFEELLLLLGQLEVVGDNFVISSANLDLATDITNTLRQLIPGSGYNTVLRGFAGEFDVQQGANDAYFKKVFGDFTPGDIMDSLKKGSVRQMVAGNLEAPFITPIRQRLEQAVSTGASRRETIKLLKVDIEGGEIGGEEVKSKLSRYVKQIMTDTFAQADRAYANQVGESLDSQWRYYTEGTVDDSRVFCIDRNGRYYHVKEVMGWGRCQGVGRAGCEWQGKIKGTNEKTIFTNLGGWNCLHSLMPVSIVVIPSGDVKRNIRKGNFQPNDQEKELLGL